MLMPAPDAGILERRRDIAAALARLVPGGVIDDATALRAYECDGLSAYRQLPLLVVLPRTTAEVAVVMRYCHEAGVKIVPRGAGTSLSGGALPLADGITI